MIRLQIQPRKVTLQEDMRDETVLLSAVGIYQILLCEIDRCHFAGLGKFTSKSTEVDGGTPGHERGAAWGFVTLFHFYVVSIIFGPFGALRRRRSRRGI